MDATERLGKNTVALITGASSGIGLVIAQKLAGLGCRVILAARRKDRLDEAVQGIGSLALALPLDIRDRAAVDKLLGSVPAAFQPVTVLINNAGHDVGGRSRFAEGSADDWSDILDTNIQGLLRITRAVLPSMLAAGSGDIVNIGSMSALHPTVNLAAYGAAKAAVHMFSDTLRSEVAGSGVRVIEILPGPVATEFALSRFRGDAAKTEAFNAKFKAPLTPDDVANSVVYALSQPPHVTIAQIVLAPSSLR